MWLLLKANFVFAKMQTKKTYNFCENPIWSWQLNKNFFFVTARLITFFVSVRWAIFPLTFSRPPSAMVNNKVTTFILRSSLRGRTNLVRKGARICSGEVLLTLPPSVTFYLGCQMMPSPKQNCPVLYKRKNVKGFDELLKS